MQPDNGCISDAPELLLLASTKILIIFRSCKFKASENGLKKMIEDQAEGIKGRLNQKNPAF